MATEMSKTIFFHLPRTGGTWLVKLLYRSSFNSDYGNTPQALLPWLRIQDDNTNRNMYVSPDGVNWKLLHSVGRTDFITANQIGFCLGLELGGGGVTVTNALSLVSWLVTTP